MLHVFGKTVAKVTVQNDKIHVDWMDDAWAQWKDLHTAPELIKLVEDNNERLRQAAEHSKEGHSKGKKGKAGINQR